MKKHYYTWGDILFAFWFTVVTFSSFIVLFYFMEGLIESNKKYECEEVAVCNFEKVTPVTEIDALDKLALTEYEDNAYFPISDEERLVAEKIVMGEAGAEPYEGQVLVAQCLLNAAIKDDLEPSTIRTEYKYSGWNEEPSESVKRAVSAVFDEGYKYIDEPILYFYAPKLVKSDWHESLDFVIEYGNHRFFKE